MSSMDEFPKIEHPQKLSSYFRLEYRTLIPVAISGILYNVGMLAGPFFEGLLAQRLLDISRGKVPFSAMVSLAGIYFLVILFVQLMRSIKRYFVRSFANHTGRNMRHMLYNSLVHMDKEQLENEGLGGVMTKAVSDVDACVEGMRKFTTEIFDTGVVLVAYLSLLFTYDPKLTLLSCAFIPPAYFLAERLKSPITRTNSEYRKSADMLSLTTMDRLSNAIVYRIYGRDENRHRAYEKNLTDYKNKAVRANLWENTMQPLYRVITMGGVIFILYFGSKNVTGTGSRMWNIAAFTTYLSTFTKMASKASRSAKLFNALQKAKVSWGRIKPLMGDYIPAENSDVSEEAEPSLLAKDLTLLGKDGETLLETLNFSAKAGEIIGITGPVASGKSTVGRTFLGEVNYKGSLRLNDRELSSLSIYERSGIISYMGHDPELMSMTLSENIQLGKDGDLESILSFVRLEKEVETMPKREETPIGDGGITLSGGQQARVALARTIFHGKKIYVLDDPFSAVDQKTELEILENLRNFGKDKIILLISHRLYSFPDLDKVLFLEDGRGHFGTHEEILQTSSGYAKLYRLQQKGGNDDEEK